MKVFKKILVYLAIIALVTGVGIGAFVISETFIDLKNNRAEEIRTLREMVQNRKEIDLANVKNLERANILIENHDANILGSGTHIKINDKSYILTCAHLIRLETDSLIAKLDNDNTYKITLLGQDKIMDLALFSIELEETLPHIEISDVEPQVGSEVVVIGNPGGNCDIVTNGIVAQIYDLGYMITNTVFFGNSGGALLYRGKLVGVVSQLRMLYNPPVTVIYGYGVRLTVIKNFIEGVMTDEETTEMDTLDVDSNFIDLPASA